MPPDQQQYQKIVGYFMEEAAEHLEIMEQGLKRLPAVMANPDREEAIAIYRAAHTIKGGAAMLMNQNPSLSSINKVAKSLEDCFKPVKDTPFQVDATAQALANKAYEVLKNLISRAQSPGGLSPQMGEKIVTASAPVFEKLQTHLQTLASGKAAPAAKPTAATAQPVPKAAAQVMTVLKPMLQGFKQPESAASRKQIAALCGRLTKVGSGVDSWQSLVKTAYGAIANPKNSYKDLANIVIKELKQGSEFLEAGKANEIAPSPALQQLVSGAAPTAAQEITIPADPKEVVKVLLKTFDKKQLQAIAQLLIKHIKS
ncbi:MAG: Hpt domain-containing protein [Lyngbya sp.]|nr:Hpt domain-containing protein [Lyngbya sp.]